MYVREITAVLPRILAWFDSDPCSPSFGLGDRLFWAWKLIDFPNATQQGAVHGLAALVAGNRLPKGISSDAVIRRIDAAIRACGRIMARDGSLSEAFPNEKSFCVTALIAFDVLCAVDFLRGSTNQTLRDDWYSVAAPMIDFIVRHDETHAIISNHLATAAAALFRWSELGDSHALGRANALLSRILEHQSPEGWFCEYGGFDPGYETLGLYYLADIYRRRPEAALKAVLTNSLNMLSYAVHPDGSFGGLYGSRNTRFIVPAALEMLAEEFPAAARLAIFARGAVERRTVPTLSTMDDPNLAPMFNAYCRALLAASDSLIHGNDLPCQAPGKLRRSFPHAGLIIDKGPSHYTIVSTKKGGVVYHFRDHQLTLNAGVAAVKGGQIYTTQAFDAGASAELDGDTLIVKAPLVRAVSERLTPLKMIILRLLSLTAFRSRGLLEMVKRLLVRRLITTAITTNIFNVRIIKFGQNLSIQDHIDRPSALKLINNPGPFRAIHMASSGYWQAGDDSR